MLAISRARAVPNRCPSGRATSAPVTPPMPNDATTTPAAAADSPMVRTKKTTMRASTPVSARFASAEKDAIGRR
jgi:hypothetical protein